MRKKLDLGDRELDLMKALWRLGKATVTEVHQALVGQGNEVAYTTVQTMLNRLEAKRLVTRDHSERAHKYRPLIKEPTVVVGAIQQLTKRFFDGSAEALATHLIEKDLDPDELERIQAIIDAHRRGRSKK